MKYLFILLFIPFLGFSQSDSYYSNGARRPHIRVDSLTANKTDSIQIGDKMFYAVPPTLTKAGDVVHKGHLDNALAGISLDSTNYFRTKSDFEVTKPDLLITHNDLGFIGPIWVTESPFTTDTTFININPFLTKIGSRGNNGDISINTSYFAPNESIWFRDDRLNQTPKVGSGYTAPTDSSLVTVGIMNSSLTGFWPLSGNFSNSGAQTITLGGNLVFGAITFNPTHNSFYGNSSTALAANSIAFGFSCDVNAPKSISIGESNDITTTAHNNAIIGSRSNTISAGTRQSIFGSGSSTISASGADNGIFGGINSSIGSTATNVTLAGTNNVSITSADYDDHTVVSNFAIWDSPSNGGSDSLLTWNSTTKKVGKIAQNFIPLEGNISLTDQLILGVPDNNNFNINNSAATGGLTVTTIGSNRTNYVITADSVGTNVKFGIRVDSTYFQDNRTVKRGIEYSQPGVYVTQPGSLVDKLTLENTVGGGGNVLLRADTVIINGWNMDVDATYSITIPNGKTRGEILWMSGSVFHDNGSSMTFIPNVGSVSDGTSEIGFSNEIGSSSTSLSVFRTTGSRFDSVNYDDDTFNRGFVVVFTINN